jgi:hypothetical protein
LVSRPGGDRHGADGRVGKAVASELERAYAPAVLVVFVSYRTRRRKQVIPLKSARRGRFDVNVRRERTVMRLANNRLFYGHGHAMPGGLSAALAIPLGSS